MTPKVSVVVPVYNVQEYIEKCLDSLSLNNPEIEVILVNDGSTDGSKDICRRYAAKHNMVRVVDKPNGGLSDARNAGVAVAQGMWIYFLDGDDWLVPKAVETLLAYAEAHGCDIVQGGFYYAFVNHCDTDFPKSMPDQLLSRFEAMEHLVNNDIIKNFAWGKLYRSKFVKRLHFPVGRYFEDVYWQYNMIELCDSYGIVSQPLYYYRQREQSISGSFSAKGLDLLIGQHQRLDFISTHYPELLSDAFRTLWRAALCHKQMSAKSTASVQRAYEEFWKQEIVATYGSYDTSSWSRGDRRAYYLSVKYPMLHIIYDLLTRIGNRLF
jgi:glycosyltransferase involved in cell wall biosynthesis